MHAFPATGENVAVPDGGNGAGSIAVAGGDQNRGGAGARQGDSTTVPRVSAWGGRAGSSTKGGSVNALGDEQFPSLPSAEEKKRERELKQFSLDERKAAKTARRAAEALTAEQHKQKKAARKARKAAEKLAAAQQQQKGRPGPRSRGGISKQERLKKLQRRMAKKAAKAERSHDRAEAEPEAERLQDDSVGVLDGADGVFTKEQSCIFAAASDGAADEAAPAKSILSRKRRASVGEGKSRDKPPAELVAALLEEFPHSNEKQAECALLTSRQLHQANGRPGWRVVHAARLMPPAPPGASSNPIELLSSDEVASSPERAAALATDRRITELALASKDTWCDDLSLSLDIEKAFVMQVFDRYQPRTYDTLVSFTLGELAEELGIDAHALADELRSKGVELGCKPTAVSSHTPGDDDDADTGGVDRRAQQQRATRGGAAASASGQEARLQENATFGATQRARAQSDLAAREAARDGVHAGDSRCSLLVAEQEQAWLNMAVGQPLTSDGGQRAAANSADGDPASASKQGSSSLSEGCTSTTAHAPSPNTNNGAADKRERDGTNSSGRLTLTDAAIKMLLELHQGEREMLVPLEGLEGGSEYLQGLIERLQAAAQAAHNLFLPRGVAVAALEVARHQHGADGWPAVEPTLHYLQRRERVAQHQGADGNGTKVGGQAPQTQTSSTPGLNAQTQPCGRDHATVPPAVREEQDAGVQQRVAALRELEELELALGEGFLPDTLRNLLRTGKFPESPMGAGRPQAAETTHNGVHPKDAVRLKAAQRLRAALGGGKTAGADGNAISGGTSDPTVPVESRGDTCEGVSNGGNSESFKQWMKRLMRTGTSPALRDVDVTTVAPAEEDVHRVAAMLLEDPSKVPFCELGAPSTRNRDAALKHLRKGLSIKMLEAERLLTTSALLHPQGKENCVNAYHLGRRILELHQRNNKAEMPPLLSSDSDSSAYSNDHDSATDDTSSSEGAGGRNRDLQRRREAHKKAFASQKSAQADGGTPASVRNLSAPARRRGRSASSGSASSSHYSSSSSGNDSDLSGGEHGSDEELDCGDSARGTGRDKRTQSRVGEERIAGRPCGHHHHHGQGTKTKSQAVERTKAEGSGKPEVSASTGADGGGTPASARLAGQEYQRGVDAAACDLESRISSAVSAAMRAALPLLAQNQAPNEREPAQESGSGQDRDALLQNLRVQLASPDLHGLGKREALAIAAKRAARNLESGLFSAHNTAQKERRGKLKRKHCGDSRGCGSGSDSNSDNDSGSSLSSEDSDHSRNRGRHNRGVPYPSPAARVSAMGQLPQQAAAAATTGGTTVVVLGNTKLPVWKMGPESNLQGFNWKTKQHIYHLWEQYMLAEGQHAPKEFKSLISPELIPVICAETGLRASDWPFLSDSLVAAKGLGF